jgi:hypothetical protein
MASWALVRILFFMHSVNYDRLFEDALVALLERGHDVQVAFDRDQIRRADDSAVFDALRAQYPRLSYGPAPDRGNPIWPIVSRGLRADRDYLRYLEPAFERAAPLRRRARERAHRSVIWLAATPMFRTSIGRRTLARTLSVLDRGVPLDSNVVAFTRNATPDVVMVTPLVNFGSPQDDYVRAAHSLGLPVVLAVASWDNLTNKGLVREAPDLTLVWNELQRREAVSFHQLPHDRVVVTGAHSYDHWFGWQPSTTAEEFAHRVGVNPDHAFLLYVGSSSFIAPQEPESVRRWLERLRNAQPDRLRHLDVLIRPHPTNTAGWDNSRLEELGAHIWPPAGERLRAADSKAGYFDSLYHSRAVVGLNTSALVEAAIVGRPVLTLVEGSTAERQIGTLHFSYIADGVLRVAHSWDEHERQLIEAIERGPDGREANFVGWFVRPHGAGRAASQIFVDAIEGAVEIEPRLARTNSWSVSLRPVLWVIALPAATRMLRKRTRRRLRPFGQRLRAALGYSKTS